MLDGWTKPNTATHEPVVSLHQPGRVELSYASNSGEFPYITHKRTSYPHDHSQAMSQERSQYYLIETFENLPSSGVDG